MIHAHSLLAFLDGKDRGIFAPRQKEIIGVLLRAGCPMSDRDIMDMTGWEDMNRVRPRITELVEAGYLDEVGVARCPVTGRKVRTVFLSQAYWDVIERLGKKEVSNEA